MASSPTVRRRAAVLVLVALVAVMNSCRANTSADGIGWDVCGPAFGIADDAIPEPLAQRLSCGRIEVPLDPADAGSGTVDLAVARIAAAGPRRGTVVVDPGGPGGSGVGHLVGAALGLASQPIAADHDLVAFDPRGVGASRPSLRCRTDAQRDAERGIDFGDRSAAGVLRIETYRRSLAEQCRDRVGGHFLTRVGTAFVVSDLDQLRRRLGLDAISFVGHSYGTRLGIEYARRYPERMRAVVLDGVVDPAEDPVDATVAQMAGFQHAFDAFAADCVTRADCPLGDRSDQAVAAYRGLVGPLIAEPAPAGGRVLSAGDAETGTVFALYGRARWADLRRALGALGSGDGAGLLRLADAYEGRGDDGHYDPMQDAFLAISCADDGRLGERARPGDLDRKIRSAAPFLDDGRASGRGPSSICELWPPPAPSPSATDVDATAAWPASAPTPLVVATTGDPATPYSAAAAFAGEVGADLITVVGVDHTAVFAGDRCVDDAVGRYLNDPTSSSAGLTC